MSNASIPPHFKTAETNSLSYKFQRLREQLRNAIKSGELAGKLPGERELAKRFHANPKTLSKALTDLAAEGLLDRSIGCGTFVRGAGSDAAPATSRWLILGEISPETTPLIEAIRRQNPEIEVVPPTRPMRPSFLDRFTCAISLSPHTSESLLRGLLVRGMTVLRLGHTGGSFQSHSVIQDTAQAAMTLVRQFLMAGHRDILVMESTGDSTLSTAARIAVQRYAPAARLYVDNIGNPTPALQSGATAVLCDSEANATFLRRLAEATGISARMSIAATGIAQGTPGFTGIYVTPAELAAAAAELLLVPAGTRPVIYYLPGNPQDRATVRVIPESPFQAAEPAAISA